MRTRLLVLACSLLAAGCTDDPNITLIYERNAPSVADSPFPSDEYRNPDNNLLNNFTVDQLADAPMLNQLATTFQTAWPNVTEFRIGFTVNEKDSDFWLQPIDYADVVRLFDISGDTASEVEIGECKRNDRATTLVCRPAVPFDPGTYAVVVPTGIRTRGGGSALPSDDYAEVIADGDAFTDEGFAKVAAAAGDISGRSDTLAYFQFTVDDPSVWLLAIQQMISGKVVVDRLGEDLTLGVTAWDPPAQRMIAARHTEVLAPDPQGTRVVMAERCAEDPREGEGCPPTEGIAAIHKGLISVPNFISPPAADPAQIFFGQTFQGRLGNSPISAQNPLALNPANPFKRIPYVFMEPSQPLDPPQVVVLVHGFDDEKEDMWRVASTVGQAGFHMIMIDHYQHGERQAGIDLPEGDFNLKTDVALAQLGLSFPDAFVNPTMMARFRDKTSQTVSDNYALFQLLAAADGTNLSIDFNGDGAADEFAERHMIGLSLGGMLTIIMAATEPLVDKAVNVAGGGGLMSILRDSASQSGTVNTLTFATAKGEGCAFCLLGENPDKELLAGSPIREVMDIVVGAVMADVDPLSYAPLVPEGKYLHLMVQGDETVPTNAQTRLARAAAKNNAAFRVLSGGGNAEREIAVGIETTEYASPASGVILWDVAHRGFVDWIDPETTQAMQQQAVDFLKK